MMQVALTTEEYIQQEMARIPPYFEPGTDLYADYIDDLKGLASTVSKSVQGYDQAILKRLAEEYDVVGKEVAAYTTELDLHAARMHQIRLRVAVLCTLAPKLGFGAWDALRVLRAAGAAAYIRGQFNAFELLLK